MPTGEKMPFSDITTIKTTNSSSVMPETPDPASALAGRDPPVEWFARVKELKPSLVLEFTQGVKARIIKQTGYVPDD